jgi:hypothetical protein
MCCGFGAAVLLFLLTVMANSTDPAPVVPQDGTLTTTNVLLVRCEVTESGRRAEVGIEFLRPRDRGKTKDNWNSGLTFEHKQVEFFTVPVDPHDKSEDANRGEAFLIINQPEKGTWRFRPYLIDFAKDGDKKMRSSSVVVKLEIFGMGRNSRPFKRSMQLPGDAPRSEFLEVFVGDD